MTTWGVPSGAEVGRCVVIIQILEKKSKTAEEFDFFKNLQLSFEQEKNSAGKKSQNSCL